MHAHIQRFLEVILLGFLPGPKRYYRMMLSWSGMAKNRKKGGKSKEDQLMEEKGNNVPQNTATKSSMPKIRPKTPAERRKTQIDGIKKTVYPSILGAAAGFTCFYSHSLINQLPWHFVLLMVIGATYFVQKVTYPLLGIDAADFKGKDWFYVEFMVIDLWLVSWTLLLN
jgi:hypothetical protein